MGDSHYRNQFETGTSNGLFNSHLRESWEEKLFGECYKDATPFERPKYGVLDIMNDPEGVVAATQYGRSYAILKQARFRCTLTPRDSCQPSVTFEQLCREHGWELSYIGDRDRARTAGFSESRFKW